MLIDHVYKQLFCFKELMWGDQQIELLGGPSDQLRNHYKILNKIYSNSRGAAPSLAMPIHILQVWCLNLDD